MGTTAADKRRAAKIITTMTTAMAASGGASAVAPKAPTTATATAAAAVKSSPPVPVPVPRTRLTLERVLGLTSLSNAMLAVNPVTGEIAYAAGCIVVIYNLRRNKQVRYYRVEKPVSCLAFAPTGQYLAIGEKGYIPSITIWDGTDGTLCAELQGHKYGVACVAFSRDATRLLSAGLVHDQQVFAWDLTRGGDHDDEDADADGSSAMRARAIGVAVLEDKILAMDYCLDGNFFVTVGERHFKYWFLDADSRFLLTGYEIDGLPEIQGRDAVLATLEGATFESVGCGYGPCKLKTFAVTKDGTLCSFGVSCVLERLVSLEASCGNAVSVTESYIAVGGSSSIVRLFDPSTLEYKGTMPFPPAFGRANAPPEPFDPQALQPEQPKRHPAAIGVRLSGSHLVVLYSDRSVFIYDIANAQGPTIDRSFLFHSGAIRDMKVAGRLCGVNAKGKLVYSGSDSLHSRKANTAHRVPHGTIVTCGDDNTVRFWHLDLHKPSKSNRFLPNNDDPECNRAEPWKNHFSQEMLDVVYHDVDGDGSDDAPVLGGTCSWDDLADIHSASKDPGLVNGLRSLAVHPKLNQIVCGDRDGTLLSAALPLHENPVEEIGAHSSEVHCIAFGEVGSSSAAAPTVLVASGGRDRVVQVFNQARGFSSPIKLDNHSGAVNSVHFTQDGKKFISCGADKNIVFSDVASDGKITRYNSVPFQSGKIFDIALSSNSQFLVASSNNRLDILNIASSKVSKSLHVGEQHHIDICPANFCVAMSGSLSDKTIHIVDLESGEILADGTGHGEVITSLKFTPDCRRLVSSSSDGCLFVWRLADELQLAIKGRLTKVTEPAALPPQPPQLQTRPHITIQVPTQAPSAPLMPPPAPPIPPKATAAKPVGQNSAPAAQPQRTHAAESGTSSDAAEAKVETGLWKGKSKAVPGPMSNAPMADWMRTRESAKKTVPVGDLSSESLDAREEHAQPKKLDDGELVIDRSKTPNWARTFKVPTRKSPAKEDVPKQPARGKWSRPGGGNDDVNSIKGDIASAVESEDPPVAAQSEGPSDGGLMTLSIANMEVNHSAVLNGSSLALEREQLEKRKKQLETAKAVADMNSRLSKLGLLRPSKDRAQVPLPTSATEDKAIESQLPSKVVEDLKPRQRIHENSRLHDIPAEMFDSIEVPLPSTQAGRESIVHDRIQVDQSLSAFTGGFKANEHPADENAQVFNVNASVSSFTGGYKTVERSRPTRKGVPESAEMSQEFENLSSVRASLSSFTEGFRAASSSERNAPIQQSLDLSDVTRSMSSFTTGYAGESSGQDPTPPVDPRQSVDLGSVTQSMSNFTSGYAEMASNRSDDIQKSVDMSLVSASLSNFTSGYQIDDVQQSPKTSKTSSNADLDGAGSDDRENGLSPIEANSEDGIESSAQKDELDIKVTESLSTFTSGYATDRPALRDENELRSPPPEEDERSKMLGSISDLDIQLAATTQSLDRWLALNDEGPEASHIRDLMIQLRGAVECFVSKRR